MTRNEWQARSIRQTTLDICETVAQLPQDSVYLRRHPSTPIKFPFFVPDRLVPDRLVDFAFGCVFDRVCECIEANRRASAAIRGELTDLDFDTTGSYFEAAATLVHFSSSSEELAQEIMGLDRARRRQLVQTELGPRLVNHFVAYSISRLTLASMASTRALMSRHLTIPH